MMGVRCFAIAMAAYRNFSTGTTGKTTNWVRSRCVKKAKSVRRKEARAARTSVKWTDQQRQIITAVSEGKSVFITGSAGTGKTFLLEHIIKVLRKRYRRSKVFVTAATGVAACAISGQTLHSFAGIGYPVADREKMMNRVLSVRRACKRWENVEALVIDESSMVDAEMFENLEYIARFIRGVDKVWGGIQLVVSGDFLQLPPVTNQRNCSGKIFAFEADCWNSSFDLQVELASVFRQSDPQLIKLLQGMRRGKNDPLDMAYLERCCSRTEPDDSVVKLYPRIEDVNKVNAERMKALNNEVIVYRAVDSGSDPSKKQLEQGIAPNHISLCKNARVMLTKNLDTRHRLVNGATGTIVGFHEQEDMDVTDICEDGLLPLVKFDSGTTVLIEPEIWDVKEGDSVIASRKQLPLILAWSLSIHKCQGMTLDRLHTDLSRAFGYGMVYVALSRVRNFEGLHLSGFDPSKIKAHPKVLDFYENFAREQCGT